MGRLIKKLKQLFYIIKHCIFNSKSAFIMLLKLEVEDYLKYHCDIGTRRIEELQDLLFHINSYIEIPETVKVTMFPSLPEDAFNTFPLKYAEYLEEVEKQRAVERFYIIDSLKYFPFNPLF